MQRELNVLIQHLLDLYRCLACYPFQSLLSNYRVEYLTESDHKKQSHLQIECNQSLSSSQIYLVKQSYCHLNQHEMSQIIRRYVATSCFVLSIGITDKFLLIDLLYILLNLVSP